jgi:hypothetical protein
MAARTRLLALLVALVAAAIPALASAGEFKRDRAGDAKAKGLSPKQRRALDIIGVDLTKTRFLTKVVVRFKARPKGTGVLVRLSFDDGTARTTVASTGRRTIGAGAGGPGGTIRSGREVALWVAGIDGNRISRVEARSFRSSAARTSAWDNPEDEVTALLQLPKADERAFTPRRPGQSLVADCERIQKMARSLDNSGPPDVQDVAEAAKQYLAQPPCSDALGP